MEEILQQIEKLESYEKNKQDLDNKQDEIKRKETELEGKKNKLTMSMGSITAQVLEEEIEQDEANLNQEKAEYTSRNKEARENFEKDKGKLRELVNKELSYYKRRGEIEQYKKDLEAQKKQTEAQLKQKEEEKEQRKGVLLDNQDRYMELADEAKAAIDRATEDFQAGKNVDQANLRLAREDFEANNKKVADIDAQIDAIDNDFQAEVDMRKAELENSEREVNSYRAIEDHMDEIRNLEHLRDSISSMSFESVDKIKNNVVVSEIRKKETEKQASKGDGEKQTPGPQQGENGQQESTRMQTTNGEAGLGYNQAGQKQDLDSQPTQVLSGKQDGDKEEGEQEQAPVITPKIKGITIGRKGVVIEYENGKTNSTEISLKEAKRISKMDASKKSELIDEIMGTKIPINAKYLNKIDANVLYALQKAGKDEIPQEELKEVMGNYVMALVGKPESKKEISGLITYDRTGMDYWKPSTFISKIVNHRYYKTLEKHMLEAREFVKIKQDVRGRLLKDLISGRKTQLLNTGKQKVEDIRTFAGKTKDALGQGFEEGKETARQKGEQFRKNLAEKIYSEGNETKGKANENLEQENKENKDGKTQEDDGEER